MNNCGDCGSSRKNSADGVYCVKYGIMIRADHEGCLHHTEGGAADGTPGEPERKAGVA